MLLVHTRRTYYFLLLVLRYATTVLRIFLLIAIGNFSTTGCVSSGSDDNVAESVEDDKLESQEVPPDHVIPSQKYRPYGRWAKFKFNYLEIAIFIAFIINILLLIWLARCCIKWKTKAKKTSDFTKNYGKKYLGIPDMEEEEEEEEEEEDDEDESS